MTLYSRDVRLPRPAAPRARLEVPRVFGASELLRFVVDGESHDVCVDAHGRASVTLADLPPGDELRIQISGRATWRPQPPDSAPPRVARRPESHDRSTRPCPSRRPRIAANRLRPASRSSISRWASLAGARPVRCSRMGPRFLPPPRRPSAARSRSSESAQPAPTETDGRGGRSRPVRQAVHRTCVHGFEALEPPRTQEQGLPQPPMAGLG